MLSHDSTVTEPNHSLVNEILRQFQLDGTQVDTISRNFQQQMNDGLNHTRPWQLPSYVYHIPNGSEKGTFLAVDLGGTNCRICLVNLLGKSKYNVKQAKHTVPEQVRINPNYEPLFSFIAEAISEFLDKHDLGLSSKFDSSSGKIPLGFTFSFTFEQTSISQGILIQWDKGWDIPEALGKDPCAMLQESIDKIKLPVHVSALANDSVGTLLSRAYTSPGCGSTLAGVIVGTGTNAAYIERLCNVQRLEKSDIHQMHQSTILNTEWGCFDDALQVLPTTPYDRALDASSSNPGYQQLEKRVSGMYLGELMRLVILHCQGQGIFNMVLNDASPCNRQYGVDSSFLSLLAKDRIANPSNIIEAVEQALFVCKVTLSDIKIMEQMVDAIAKRSARLVGSALGAIIVQSGRLNRIQSDKHMLQFTSEQVRLYDSPSLHDRKRGCGLLARITTYVRNFTTWTTKEQVSSRHEPAIGEGEDLINIGVEGSLIELYPGFETYVRSALVDVRQVGSEGERRIKMGVAMDGSSVGAALIANAAMST